LDASSQLAALKISLFDESKKGKRAITDADRDGVVPDTVLERVQKVATSADKCLKDSQVALKLFDHAHMSLMSNKDSENKSLGVVMCDMQAAMTPIQQVLLIGKVHAPDNAQSSNVEYLNVKLADLVTKMKACFEKVEFAKAMSQQLKGKKEAV